MKYSKGEFVYFKSNGLEAGGVPSQRGVISEIEEEYNMYYITSIEAHKDCGRIYLKDESDILHSLNSHVVTWTKTAEKLPETTGWYLGSVLYMGLGNPITLPVYYNEANKIFTVDGDKFKAEEKYPEVFAWMALPDPYKGDDRGKW